MSEHDQYRKGRRDSVESDEHGVLHITEGRVRRLPDQPAPNLEEARQRLAGWLDEAGMHSRYHRPYANPGELRADVRALLNEREAREEIIAHFVNLYPEFKSYFLPATESAQAEQAASEEGA